MSTYFIGDIHGCYNELQKVLTYVSFDEKKDDLWITGDLVGRGPNSLEVLRFLYSLKNSVSIVLGNYDLHFLAIHAEIKTYCHFDEIQYFRSIMKNDDIDELIYWLRCQPLLQVDENRKIIMTHAGITPQWNIMNLKKYAFRVHKILSNKSYAQFLDKFYYANMYNQIMNNWKLTFDETQKLYFSINALTRMRYCFSNGSLSINIKNISHALKKNLKPWFNINRLTDDYTIIFGHWSELQKINIKIPKKIIPLDTGCCWGASLTILRWEDLFFYSESCKK